MLSVGSLFSGIGGLELGLERAGMECAWQVEIDDYATQVLAKHWPDVPRYRDVRECHGEYRILADATSTGRLALGRRGGESGEAPDNASQCGEVRTLPYVDLICGGFPCQDVSLAGARAGLDGKRSTLWSEFARLIRELRPRWVLAENVPGLLSSDDGRFFGNILRDLAAAGYDAEWGVLSAADMGAPHLRRRVFIVAHAEGGVSGQSPEWEGRQSVGRGNPKAPRFMADASLGRQPELREPSGGCGQSECSREDREWWQTEPDVGRVADGIPSRVDRLRCLGNAVVPQCAEWIGRRILDMEGR